MSAPRFDEAPHEGCVPSPDGEYVLYSDYAALEAQNRQLREAHIWKPIETAPMNGTLLLLARIDEKDGSVIQAEEGCWEFIETSDWDGQSVYDWTTTLGSIETPTHWMMPIRAALAATEPKETK